MGPSHLKLNDWISRTSLVLTEERTGAVTGLWLQPKGICVCVGGCMCGVMGWVGRWGVGGWVGWPRPECLCCIYCDTDGQSQRTSTVPRAITLQYGPVFLKARSHTKRVTAQRVAAGHPTLKKRFAQLQILLWCTRKNRKCGKVWTHSKVFLYYCVGHNLDQQDHPYKCFINDHGVHYVVDSI